MRTPRVFSVATIAINLPMRLEHLPERGSTVVVSKIGTEVGGAFNVMSAIARQGVDVINVSPLGTGPNSMFVRRSLTSEHIETCATEVVGDTGTKLVFIEQDGSNTSVFSPGVESEISPTDLAALDIADGDFVYVYGGDLTFDTYRKTLISWLSSLDVDVKVVVAASPQIDESNASVLQEILPYVYLLTMNKREYDIICDTFNMVNAKWKPLYEQGLRKDAIIIHRLGGDGCIFYSKDFPDGHYERSLMSEIVDTSGVGDAHTGVVIASLAQGEPIQTAVRRANLAGAQVIAKYGSATCPMKEDIDQLIMLLDDKNNPKKVDDNA